MGRHTEGWIKFYRSLVNSDIGRNGYCLAITATIFAWAKWQEEDKSKIRWNGAPRTLEKGQLVLGLRELAEHLGFSKETVHRQLKYLESRDTIKREVATEGTLITIVNYEHYQNAEEKLRHSVGQEPNASQTLAKREPTPNEEVQEEKKERSNTPDVFENENIVVPPPVSRPTGIPDEVKKEWSQTLEHYGKRPNWARDDHQLYQLYAIQAGKDWARLKNALRGFRSEQKSKDYDPARYVYLGRLTDKVSFAYLENLGEQSAGREVKTSTEASERAHAESLRRAGIEPRAVTA